MSNEKLRELEGCKCQECGDDFLTDIIVSDEKWEEIKPTGKAEGAGLLCPICIIKKLSTKEKFKTYFISEKSKIIKNADTKELTKQFDKRFGYLKDSQLTTHYEDGLRIYLKCAGINNFINTPKHETVEECKRCGKDNIHPADAFCSDCGLELHGKPEVKE